MPRPKRKLVLPKVTNFIDKDGTPVVLELITEETEDYGAGAVKKVQKLRNFEIGLNHIANKIFFNASPISKVLEKQINKKVRLVGITRELQFTDIELEERAMRNLAKKIKKAIQGLQNAIKENG